MAIYKFTAAQRWAVFTVHHGRCWLCGDPVDLQSMQVDHIVPESLVKSPAKLAKVKKQFGLPASFDLNSFANWMPAHSSCNNRKRDIVSTRPDWFKLTYRRLATWRSVQQRSQKRPFQTQRWLEPLMSSNGRYRRAISTGRR